MTETKPKRKPKLELRDPARPLAEPEARPLDPNHPAARIFSQVTALTEEQQQRSGTTIHHPPPTHQPPPTSQVVAPERDFTRVANSIVRNAVPAGLFRGESKKLYDAIYHRTRGAVVPRRKIRATQAELMEWARVSHNTLKSHLKHLSRVGLLKIHYVRGDNTGAEYEVFLPEEAIPSTTHHPPTNYQPTTSQNLAPPTSQNLVLGGGGQVSVNSDTSGDPKTSFKTNTERSDDDDDAALAGLSDSLKSATKEITGKDLSPADKERWREVADVLVAELKIAAARTTVSSVPAFLAEHLRRRLWKIDKKQAHAEGRELPDEMVSQAPSFDASKCPDCGGSGWWYPEGEIKGVARCKHEKLAAES
ncbi:MAG TPA: hypothetical protein VGC87_18890 [Pyrinomonadaceae bacterium]|jgi:hypothetical protein